MVLTSKGADLAHLPPLRFSSLAGLRRSPVAGGIKKVAVTSSEYDDFVLKPPPDDFLPIQAYRKRFGSPSRPALRKLGHKKATIRGVVGVMFPPEDSDQPWKAFAGLVIKIRWGR